MDFRACRCLGLARKHRASTFLGGVRPVDNADRTGGDNSFPIKGAVPGHTAPAGLPPPCHRASKSPGVGGGVITAPVPCDVFVTDLEEFEGYHSGPFDQVKHTI